MICSVSPHSIKKNKYASCMRLAYIHSTNESDHQYHLSCCKILWIFRQYGQAGLQSMPEQLTQTCTAFCATCHVSYLTPLSELCMHNPPQPCEHACTRSSETLVAHIKASSCLTVCHIPHPLDSLILFMQYIFCDTAANSNCRICHIAVSDC